MYIIIIIITTRTDQWTGTGRLQKPLAVRSWDHGPPVSSQIHCTPTGAVAGEASCGDCQLKNNNVC